MRGKSACHGPHAPPRALGWGKRVPWRAGPPAPLPTLSSTGATLRMAVIVWFSASTPMLTGVPTASAASRKSSGIERMTPSEKSLK